MVDRPTVLILAGNYLPGYRAGGPVRSLANLVEALGSEFDFRVVASDTDLGERLPYPGVTSNVWVPLGKAHVMYVRPGWRGAPQVVRVLRDGRYDVLYLNSFFSRVFSILPIVLRRLGVVPRYPLVLAPRGEFSRGALALKPFRKRMFVSLSTSLGLYRDVSLTWHASTALEGADIQRVFRESEVELARPIGDGRAVAHPVPRRGPATIVTALDVTDTPQDAIVMPVLKEPGHLRVIFISRVSRKKNLAGALRLLLHLRSEVVFDMYGPIQDRGYWFECERLLRKLPPNVHAAYRGDLEHSQVSQVLSRYHLFLFPTRGENFGHVIAEALSAGCPVLTSDQTPWNDLEEHGVGWSVPLADEPRFISLLALCAGLDNDQFQGLSARARAYARRRAYDPEAVAQHRMLFLKAFEMASTGARGASARGDVG